MTFLSRDLRHQHTRREQIRALRDTERELALVPNPKASRAPKHETDHDRALTLGLRLDTKIGKWCRACHGLSHRRHWNGCVGCGLPFAHEIIERREVTLKSAIPELGEA